MGKFLDLVEKYASDAEPELVTLTCTRSDEPNGNKCNERFDVDLTQMAKDPRWNYHCPHEKCGGFMDVTLKCPNHSFSKCTNTQVNTKNILYQRVEVSYYVWATTNYDPVVGPENFSCKECGEDMKPVLFDAENDPRRRRLVDLERHLEVVKRAYNM